MDFDINEIEATTKRVCSIHSPIEQLEIRAGRPEAPGPMPQASAFTGPVEVQGLVDEAIGVPGPWSMTGSQLHFRGQQPATSVQQDAFPYDPTISLPALSFPAMDSSVWDPSAQDISRVSIDPFHFPFTGVNGSLAPRFATSVAIADNPIIGDDCHHSCQ